MVCSSVGFWLALFPLYRTSSQSLIVSLEVKSPFCWKSHLFAVLVCGFADRKQAISKKKNVPEKNHTEIQEKECSRTVDRKQIFFFNPPFLCRKGLLIEHRTFLPGKSSLGRSHRDSRYVWKVMEGSSIYKKQDFFILSLPWTLPRALAPARPYGLASDEY